LERALEHLGHEGLLLVDLPASRVHPVRFRKLAQAGTSDLEDASSNAREHLAFTARRHNPTLPILSDPDTPRELAAVVMVEEES
ncbi:MAG: hypothetical protein KDB53_05365, partial [Planctomycetes bacterium]|nr:hypothetical protein [Planctomycetota bacterium]